MTTPENSLQHIHFKDLTLVCIHISLQNDRTNFKLNPAFATQFANLLKCTIRYCEKIKECVQITQHANFILIFMDSTIASTYTHLIKKIENLIEEIFKNNISSFIFNKKEEQLRISVAVVQSITKWDISYTEHPLFHDYIWLGDIKKQALILAQIAGTRNFPNFLISHSVYMNLSKPYQKKFSKKYYHDHICCYAPVISHIDRPKNYWYSEYCGRERSISGDSPLPFNEIPADSLENTRPLFKLGRKNLHNMKMKEETHLLTIKEFSELTHTTIPALKHYDRIHILKPAFIGENKYRYYKPEQALQLTRILFGVRTKTPLSNIKEILSEDDPCKSARNYQQIYNCMEETILERRALEKKLINIIYNFDIIKHHPLETPFLTYMPENFYLYAKEEESQPGRLIDSVSSIAGDLFMKEFRNQSWPHFPMGTFYPEGSIQKNNFADTYYFLRTDHPEYYSKEETQYFPEGNYVCYLTKQKNGIQQFLDAVKRSDYKIQGNIYTLGVISSLLTSDTNQYCTMFYAQLNE